MVFRKLNVDERFIHSPTKTSFDGVDIEIKENGTVIFSKRVEGFTAPGEEYDEVEIKAGTIFKVASLLRDTRKIIRLPEAK